MPATSNPRGKAWLVSKAGPRVQEKTLRWLAHHRFHDRTDVLHHLAGIVRHRYLVGPQRPGTPVPAGAIPVRDWAAARAAVERDLAGG